MKSKIIVNSKNITVSKKVQINHLDAFHLLTTQITTRSGLNPCFIINISAKKNATTKEEGEYDIKIKFASSTSENHKTAIYKLKGLLYGQITLLKNYKNIHQSELIQYLLEKKQITIDSGKKGGIRVRCPIKDYDPFNDSMAIILKIEDARWTKSQRNIF